MSWHEVAGDEDVEPSTGAAASLLLDALAQMLNLDRRGDDARLRAPIQSR